MTSVSGSAILIAVSLILLVVLVMKGVNLIAASLAAAAILAFAVPEGWFKGIFDTFAIGAGGYAQNLLVPFMMGGIFGSIMMASGSDLVIGRTLIDKFGVKFAVYSLGIFVAIMGVCGISSWPFLGAILAFSLMRACDLPLQVACVVMLGINSAFACLLPGAPTIPNLIASQALGTTIYSGAFIGVVMAVVQIILVYLYVNLGLIRDYRRRGIGYTPAAVEASLRGGSGDTPESEQPSFAVAVIPLVIVIGLCMVLQFGFSLSSTMATVLAQIAASVVCVLLNVGRGVLKKVPGSVSNGVVQTSAPLIGVCAVVGYASLITNTAVYGVLIEAVSSMSISPYVMVVLGTAIFAAIGADPMSGIAMSVSSIAPRAIAAGADAGLVHRLTLAASTTFDSMPHSSNLNVTMGFLGLTHKDVYRQIVVVQIGTTTAATLVGMFLSMIIG